MMKYFFLASMVFLKSTGFSQEKTYQGEYGNGTAKKGYSLLQIHYKPNGEILFYIEDGRGAPSYNSGAMYGRLSLNKADGHMQYMAEDTTSDCSLDFNLVENGINVITVHGNCRYGGGVYPDGFYKRKKKASPDYFQDRKGQKIYFDKTSPEDYLF